MRGARVCYCDSWQHHEPAFAAWPAIVFLVSLQSAVRSILPRSSTTASASFAASYFTGAQHGVARYLGNFAERGCSLCQQPVPRRQRIRRSLRRSRSRIFRFPTIPLVVLLPSLLVLLALSRRLALSSPQQGSRVRANLHSRVSAFTIVAPSVLLRLSLLARRTPIRLVLVARIRAASSILFYPYVLSPGQVVPRLAYTTLPRISRAPDSTRERNTNAGEISIPVTATTTETRRRVVYRTGRTHRVYATKFGRTWQLALD